MTLKPKECVMTFVYCYATIHFFCRVAGIWKVGTFSDYIVNVLQLSATDV